MISFDLNARRMDWKDAQTIRAALVAVGFEHAPTYSRDGVEQFHHYGTAAKAKLAKIMRDAEAAIIRRDARLGMAE